MMHIGPLLISVLKRISVSVRVYSEAMWLIILIMTAAFPGPVVRCKAQNQQIIDSLQKELSYAREDSNKTRLYYRIWQQYRKNDMTEAQSYAHRGLAHAQKIKWDKGIAAFYTSLGEGFNNRRKDDSAVFYYNRAIDIYKKINFSKGLAGVYNNMSALYGDKSDYVKAIEYSFKALNIVLETKDTSYAVLTLNNIGKYYYNQEDYSKAKAYVLRALNMAERAGLDDGKGNSYSNLAMIFEAQKDTVQSIRYYNRSIRMFEESQDLIGLAETYSNLSTLQKDYRLKLEYSLKARALFDSLQLTNHLVSIANFGNIGVDYFDLVRFKGQIKVQRGGIIPYSDRDVMTLAEQYLSKSVRLSRESDETDNLYHFLKVLGELEEHKGNPAKALAYYKESYALSDSLFSQENKNRIAALESKRAIDERDRRLAINQLELRNARQARIALIAGAILLFIIGGLLFYQNVHRRRSNLRLLKLNKELDEANRIKTRFFAILSHDLRGPVANLVHFLHLQKEAPELLDEESAALRQQKQVHAAENLLEIMETVLLWSKSQMERFVPQKKSVAVNDLFDYIRRHTLIDSAISVCYINPDNISVITDKDYINTILYNLTTNAVKALKNVPNSRLEWKAIKENGLVMISITDNGPGLSAEQINVLFNKEASIGTKQGLGLHIIRDLAKAAECRISVSERENNCNTITLII